jgi:hypothetical protein
LKVDRFKYGGWVLTLVFGIAVFLFWRYRYPFALTYQEQLQLFLFDGDYFCERLSEPGGLARYIAEFLVQFYNGVTFGASILAVLFMLLQRLTWRLMATINCHSTEGCLQGKNYQLYPLSFLPALMLWYAMGDESVMLTYVVALVMALAVALLLRRLELVVLGKLEKLGNLVKLGILLLLIPLLYWLIGPMVLLVAALMLPLTVAAVAVIYSLALILLSAHYLPFPMSRVVLGISYYRIPEVLPYVLMAIPVVIILLVWLCWKFPAVAEKQKKWVYVAELVVLVVAAVLIIPRGYDAKKYELIEYDYLVRTNQWNAIIAKAEKQMPDLPMSVSATNLALGMTNQLGERAFDFYQRGSEGLLPKFERNFATAQLTGEIYFHLGLVNTAQRFAFEAMEAIPNYNKSARVVKRLAETNMINGQYKVAEKYLKMLEKTVFYRPWAKRMMTMLGDEKVINGHPLYGQLRQYRLQEDFLFSETELDKICGQLFVHNPQNQMAMQYLMLMPLLDKDIPRFMSYVQVVQERAQYRPRSCQEALAFAFMQQRQQPPRGLISDMILQQMNEFSRIYSHDKNSHELARFKNTVWYYLTNGK